MNSYLIVWALYKYDHPVVLNCRLNDQLISTVLLCSCDLCITEAKRMYSV